MRIRIHRPQPFITCLLVTLGSRLVVVVLHNLSRGLSENMLIVLLSSLFAVLVPYFGGQVSLVIKRIISFSQVVHTLDDKNVAGKCTNFVCLYLVQTVFVYAKISPQLCRERLSICVYLCDYYWLNYFPRVLGHDLAIKLLKMQQLDDEDDELAYR